MNTGPEQPERGRWWARGILPALGLLALATGLLIAWQTNIQLQKQLEEVESEREYLEQQKLSDALNIREQEGRATTAGPGEIVTADVQTAADVRTAETMPATPGPAEIPDLVHAPGTASAEIPALAPEPDAIPVVAETGAAATASQEVTAPAAQAAAVMATAAAATPAGEPAAPAARIPLPERFQQMFANDDGVGMRWDFTRKFWRSMRDFPDEAAAIASAAKWNAATPKGAHGLAARAAGFTYMPDGKRVLLIRADGPAPATIPPPPGEPPAATKATDSPVIPGPVATTPARPGPRPARVPSPVEWTAVPNVEESGAPRARQVTAGGTQIVPGSTPIPLPAAAKHNFVISHLNIGLVMRWDERSQAWYSADPRQVNGQAAALVASMNAARGTCSEDKAALAAGYVYQSFSPSQLLLGPPDLQPSDVPAGLATATAAPAPGFVPATLPVKLNVPRSFTNSNKLKMEMDRGFYVHDPKGKKKSIFLPAHADALNRASMGKDEKALFNIGYRYQAVDGKLFFGPAE